MNGLLNCIIVTKSLPLSIHRIHASAREDSLLDEPLPVHLILILLARKFLRHSENLDKFANRKSRPLARELLDCFEGLSISQMTRALRILDLHDNIGFHGQPFSLADHVEEPLIGN